MVGFADKERYGFTLAEMMIVMLILTIILAMAAPLMTKKRSIDESDSPWHWAQGKNNEAFFGVRTNQTAMIGQAEKANNDGNAKLIIKTENNAPAILFKNREGAGTDNKIAELVASAVEGVTYNPTLKMGGPYENSATGAPVTAFGVHALKKSSADFNTAFGYGALEYNTSGTANLAIGTFALNRNTQGENNIAIGEGEYGDMDDDIGTLYSNTKGSNNIAIGRSAMQKNTLGNNNIAIGVNALKSGTHKLYSIYSDYNQLTKNNIAIGTNALSKNTRTENSVAIGYNAMQNGTTGQANVAIGTDALRNNTGSMNVAIGSAQYDINPDVNPNPIFKAPLSSSTSAGWNVAIGTDALGSLTTGDYNVAVGYSALMNNQTGQKNVAIGEYACSNVKGSNKTCIGAESGPSSGTDIAKENNTEKVVWIGDASTTVYIPGNLIVADNKDFIVGKAIYLKSTGDREPYFSMDNDGTDNLFKLEQGDNLFTDYFKIGESTAPPDISKYNSDKRLKNIKGESKSGLEQVRALKVFDFTFKKDEKKTPHVGVIAQDLQKIFPDAVTKGEDGYLKIRTEDMFYSVVNAVKELDNIVQGILNEIKVIYEKITGIDTRVKALEQENKQLKQDNKQLKKEISDITKRLEKLEKK